MAPHEVDCLLPVPGLSVRHDDGYIVAAISGELDIACVPALRERLLGLLRPDASRLVIDLSAVTFCDASGLAVLVGTGRRARLLDGILRLAAPTPPVATVLRLTGLDLWFEIFPTVSAAVRAPGHPGVRDPNSHRRVSAGRMGAPPSRSAGSLQGPAAVDDNGLHETVASLLAQADAWRDADPDRRLTRSLRALARAHAGADRTALAEAARSLLAGLLRHPLTHSAAVASTATDLRRLLASGTHRSAVSGWAG